MTNLSEGSGTKTQLAIFASGAGSNAQKIIDFFRSHSSIVVALIVSNKAEAAVLDIARKEQIPFIVIEKNRFFESDEYIDLLREQGIDWIILAGFLWKLPPGFIAAFPKRIVNIHPALLPKYGGKGMYGMRVHEAVIQNRDSESGISIHLVDELYDHGEVIFRATCTVDPTDTPESLAQKIHQLEHAHFAKSIESFIEKNR